ncbi:CMRF35-like molecule 1 isoform X2 [Ictalurus punctatus]|uniref:CMRF35-like molecule 1 isoform X2 n=1 Tax=Ictalurus punctatus TaxID=7998 RepID=A0A2D0Q3E7_ICTPU|nr:CMRF35-like molecule 1 isoform X2 [Ictalurus punctatus]
MKILLIFTFCLIIAGSDAVTTVTGYRGRSVQIKCPYGSGYEEYKKYLCRGECPRVGYNDVPVRSGSPAKDTRFSLYDNTTAKVFTVTITDLRTEDGNTYWCGIERTGYDSYTELLLLVKTANPLNDANHPTVAPSPQGAVLLPVGVIIAIYCKIHRQGSETVTRSSTEANGDYENDQNLPPLQAKQQADLPESVYQSLDLTTNQSVYQSLTFTNNQ